jgi:hypothetical protein
MVDEFLAVRLANPPPLEGFPRLVAARQETARLNDLRISGSRLW